MEQKVEGAVDKWLGSISSGLYLYSIAFGIVLVILGVFLLFKKKGSERKQDRFLWLFGLPCARINCHCKRIYADVIR